MYPMDERKRVLILTADMGFGHRSAAKALAEAIREVYGDQCLVEIVNPLNDRRIPSVIRNTQTDYDKMVRKMPDVYKLQYQFSDSTMPAAVIERALAVAFYQVVGDILKRVKPDVILDTHGMYMASLNTYITLHGLSIPYLSVITDLTDVHRLWFNEGADLYLVPTQEAYDHAISLGIHPERARITGVPINPGIAKEKRDPSTIRAELGWSIEATTALVVGSKRVKNLMKVLHVLNHSGFSLQLVLVAGGDEDLYTHFKSTEWHLVTHVYNYVDSMPAFMRASDFIISKAGGLTITEALACGLPLLLVDVTPGQEKGNAEYVVKRGAGDLAENPFEMLEILAHWFDRDRQLLRERARISRSLGRPRSAYQAADLAWQAAELGRTVPSSRLLEWVPKFKELLHTFNVSITDDN
jgi:1,2-diacylglycerol 3-beta-galactosyltransferase